MHLPPSKCPSHLFCTLSVSSLSVPRTGDSLDYQLYARHPFGTRSPSPIELSLEGDGAVTDISQPRIQTVVSTRKEISMLIFSTQHPQGFSLPTDSAWTSHRSAACHPGWAHLHHILPNLCESWTHCLNTPRPRPLPPVGRGDPAKFQGRGR